MGGLSPLAPLSPAAGQKMGQDFSRKPVGTGPFMVKEWVPKSHVTLVRNPDYACPPATAAHRGPAYLDEITWRFVLEATTPTAGLTPGEAHLADYPPYPDAAVPNPHPTRRHPPTPPPAPPVR